MKRPSGPLSLLKDLEPAGKQHVLAHQLEYLNSEGTNTLSGIVQIKVLVPIFKGAAEVYWYISMIAKWGIVNILPDVAYLCLVLSIFVCSSFWLKRQ